MTLTVEDHSLISPQEHLPPLMVHLTPTFQSLVSPKTDIIEVTLQLKPTDNLAEVYFPYHIKLAKIKERAPFTHHAYPILYQRQEIGTLHLTRILQTNKAKDKHQEDTANLHYRRITKTLSFLIKRYQSTYLSNQYLGKEISLSGYSETMLQLDSFIEKAASTFCPVIICGDIGSEKLSVASAIHYNSDIKHKPFIEVNCSTPSTEEFKKNLLRSIKQANSGCIYLHAIDELSPAQQNLLTELFATSTAPGIADQTFTNIANITKIRLLVSTTESLKELVQSKEFSGDLYERFNFLHIKIPSLLQRKEDIPYILQSLVKKYRVFPEQELSSEVKEVLCDYHWPNNYAEIERIIARLLTLAMTTPVSIDDVQQYSPELLSKDNHTPFEINSSHRVKKLDLDLIPNLKNKDYDTFKHLHRGLYKALVFLAENYFETITLTILSQQAFISPSHLSHLFKHNLNKTFKQILTELRIEKAKHIISTTPHRLITEVCLDVGFADLSHFEKMFKRFTQMTPRKYKQSMKTRLIIN